MRVVIVGNGVAGIEAALVVRQREPGWTVTVVSEESDHFFSRTALMYVLSGQLRRRDIEPYERDLYARTGLVRVRARATGLDLERRELRLGGGLPPLPFDRLLIAAGSRPRPRPWPGSELAGIGHFVTMQDLSWLEAELHGGGTEAPPRPDEHKASSGPASPYWTRARSGRVGPPRAPVVIGGGLIGVEVVETLLTAGLRPRFLIKQEWFWPVALDRAEAEFVVQGCRSHGVDVALDEEVVAFEGHNGDVTTMVTSKGQAPCDLAVVAIGVLPNTEWLAESGLSLDRAGGLIVDAGLQTSAPGVFAAGDCASVAWFDGRVQPEQLWYTARDQGRMAGARLVGDAARYSRGIWYNSAKFLDIEYTTVGLVNMSQPGESEFYFEERGRVRSTLRVVTVEDRIIGFNALGRRWDTSVIRRWIEERRPLAWVKANLSQAAFDTEFVPPLRLS